MPTTPSDKAQLNVRIPETQAEQLRVVAEVYGVNVSDLASKAFAEYLSKTKEDPDWQDKHKKWADKQRALLRAMK